MFVLPVGVRGPRVVTSTLEYGNTDTTACPDHDGRDGAARPAAERRERQRIADFVSKARIPTMYSTRELAQEGGLMSYGPSQPDLFRRATGYVDKILKGAKPSDLPVEQPILFELIIGLTIPPAVLARADEVIP